MVEELNSDPIKRRSPIRSKPAFRKPKLNVQQPELLPRSIDEMVDGQDACRLVVKLVKLLDLSSLRSVLFLEGAPNYPIEMMLWLEIFSKWDGVYSSRDVEKHCKHDVRYIWLCAGHTPNHSTIWRFRRFLGDRLDALVEDSVRLGKEAGLESLGRVSIDGTRLPCAASQWRKFRDASDEADHELTQKLEDKREVPKAVAEKSSDPSSNESEATQEERASEVISKCKKVKKERIALPSTDPDARTIITRQGHFIVGYNTQVIVDRDTDLIMSYNVTNQSSDFGLLEPTLAKHLGLYGELPEDLLADAGYDSPNNAHALAEIGIDGCISPKDRALFWSLDEKDRLICPMGNVAVYEDAFKRKGLLTTRLKVHECGSCPLKKECLAKEDSKYKTISFDARVNPAHWIRLRQKSRSPEGKERLKERGKTIEFSFACMKDRLGLRRLSMWGFAGANIEVGIVALALNLSVIGAKVGHATLEELLQALFVASKAVKLRIWCCQAVYT